MNKINVAIILPGTVIGGAETMASQLAVSIDKNSFNVFFILVHSLAKNRVLDILNSDSRVHLISLDENHGISFKAVRKMNRVLKEIKPDIIHTHLHTYPYVAAYAIFHHITIIHTIHNLPLFESLKTGRIILKFLFKLKFACPVGISNVISIETNRLYKIRNTITIYNPVDTKKFIPSNNSKNNVFTFITVGRMTEQKNQKLLISAFGDLVKSHKDVQLFIAGDGPLRDELIKCVEDSSLENNVTFLGNVNNIEYYYSKCHVFVLSSNYEGLPMTILEAMSAGLPIISTNVGGVCDILTNNGILVEPNNKEKLTSAMELLLKNSIIRNQFEYESLKSSKKYDITIITNEYENVYRKFSRRVN